MEKMQTPTTLAQFKRAAEEAFERANPDASEPLFNWVRGQQVTWHDGTSGFAGSVIVRAEGFRARQMSATAGDDYIMVR